MFTREFGYQIATYVNLCDPNRNEHEVMIEKRYGKLYLIEGWRGWVITLRIIEVVG